MDAPAPLGISHFELTVRDLPAMRAFYTDVLGFVVTDEGPLGPRGLVFLSRNPGEHHQLVLAGGRPEDADYRIVGHVAFRVGSLAALREVWQRIRARPHGPVEEVTHGTTWSVYFRDPEGNRLECFVDTPWHTPQPCREPIDFRKPDDALMRETEALCRARPGFQPRAAWFAEHAGRFAP